MATPIFPANVGRQTRLLAVANIKFSDIANGSIVSGVNIAHLLDLPSNYLVLSGMVYVQTAFVGLTAPTITIGDGTLTTRYASAVALTAAATTAFTAVPFQSSTIADAEAFLTFTGGPATAGNVWVVMEYVIPGRATEVQPS